MEILPRIETTSDPTRELLKAGEMSVGRTPNRIERALPRRTLPTWNAIDAHFARYVNEPTPPNCKTWQKNTRTLYLTAVFRSLHAAPLRDLSAGHVPPDRVGL